MSDILSTTFYGQNIKEWTVEINKRISQKYEMKPIKILEGDYGFDSISAVVYALLSNINVQNIYSAIQGGFDKSSLIEVAHDAWCKKYVQWKNISFELSTNPKKTINTHRRNDRATTCFENLSQDDLELYNDFIDELFKILTQNIIEAGMKNMKI